jgi:tetratricopeptide (TPR) repeat protein
LGGTVSGPVVQARDIRGDVHLHQVAASLPTPSQLPAVSMLVNRDETLAQLDAVRSRRSGSGIPGVVVLSGPAGIGKTAAALYWAHGQHQNFPDGRLYADLRGNSVDEPVEPAEILGQFIRAFGIAPDRIPGGLAERAALYQSLVAGRRLVVVLDDAVSAAQVSPLLPASVDCVALVTSRWRLAGLLARGAHGVQLDRLSPDAALELLRRTLGSDRIGGEMAAARRLVELCARFPIALSVAAARLATRPHWPLTDMVEALSHERQRLNELAAEDDMTIRAALAQSYKSLSPPGAARLYRLLGLFPGATFDGAAAAATAALPRAEARRLLGVLADANLLDDVPGGGYRFHDLTRLHARETAELEEPEAVRDETVRRALDWFLHAATLASQAAAPYRRIPPPELAYEPAEPIEFAGPAEALDWLDHEFRNLRTATRTAYDRALFRTAWQLVDAIWPLFLHRGHYAERLHVDRIGLAAARAGHDSTAEAKMLNRTGLALRALRRLDEAADDFREAAEIWRRLGNAYRMAGARRRLGLLEVDRGRFDQAITLFTEAIDGYRTAGESRRLARTLCDLGDALVENGRPAEAIPHVNQARQLLAGSDPYNGARALIVLARARRHEPVIAADLAGQGLRAMREIGSQTGETVALQVLGDLDLDAGRRDDARRHYEDARRILIKMGAGTGAVDERLARLTATG